MVPEEQVEPQQKENTGKKLPGWLVFLFMVIAVFIVSVSAVVFTTKVLLPMLEKKQVNKTVAQTNDFSRGLIYEMDELTVNTSDIGGRRFVVVKIAFDVASKKVEKELKDNEVRLRDEFISFFHQQPAQTILAPGFQDYARKQLIEITEKHLSQKGIKNLYFTELLVQ